MGHFGYNELVLDVFKPQGIIPPHITPFTKNGDIDAEGLRRNVDFWLEAGVHGLATCASNGEAVYMNSEERRQVLKVVIDQANGRVPILAGTGAPSTREAILQTKEAKDLGVDAALIITPYFFSPKQEEILGYYQDICAAIDIPIILYNVPKFTGVNMEASVVAKMAEYDNVVGVKDSSSDMRLMQALISAAGDRISILAGSGNMVFPTLASGGHGGIVAVANVAPSRCVEIYEKFIRGDLKGAREAQADVLVLNDLVTKQYGVPALKAAMNLLGLSGGYPRRPLLPVSERVTEELKRVLTSLKLEYK
jgi:4-hydroxy-tetrahydrodipicolinate synthase